MTSVAGDLVYLNLAKLHEKGFAPRRKPRGQERPPDDVLYNRAFLQFSIIVEQPIGQLRRFHRHRSQLPSSASGSRRSDCWAGKSTASLCLIPVPGEGAFLSFP
jgi:hypothetical protein